MVSIFDYDSRTFSYLVNYVNIQGNIDNEFSGDKIGHRDTVYNRGDGLGQVALSRLRVSRNVRSAII